MASDARLTALEVAMLDDPEHFADQGTRVLTHNFLHLFWSPDVVRTLNATGIGIPGTCKTTIGKLELFQQCVQGRRSDRRQARISGESSNLEIALGQ